MAVPGTAELAPKSAQAWQFVQQMLADMTQMVRDDAESELPRFFDMSPSGQMIGGPNPDGNYYLAMIHGDRTYRVTGTRGSTAYLGFQILAGTGVTPRRMSGYVSDTDLTLHDGAFTMVLSSHRPDGADQGVPIPADASSIVVREYVGDAATERPAALHIETLDPAAPQPVTDDELAEQFTSMAWTLAELATLQASELIIPGFLKFHPMGALVGQECVRIFASEFTSMIFGVQYRLPNYHRWLLYDADTPAPTGSTESSCNTCNPGCPDNGC